jgi:hypothetical protein
MANPICVYFVHTVQRTHNNVDVTEGGGSRKLHNQDFHNLYSAHNIGRVIFSWRLRWVEHAGRIEM